MKKYVMTLAMFSLCALAVTAQAEWVAEQNPSFVGGYSVKNTKTGQRLNTRYKTEKKAKKAAKALNKSDKSVMAGPDGQGDYRPGGGMLR